MQLGLCETAHLLPERAYDRDKKSVDFFLVFSEVTVLVEAKATPLTMISRMGGETLNSDIARALGKGVEQLNVTAALVERHHRDFVDLPTDRPLVGLLVTLEPYYACDNDLVCRAEPGSIPIVICSIGDIEYLVSTDTETIGPMFAGIAREVGRRDWSLRELLSKRRAGKNRILDLAWNQYQLSR